MLWLEFAVVAIAIYLGARMGGIGLGVTGMMGLLVFTLFFGLKPADPPLEVMLIILSVVTTAAAMQAAGGMDYLVSVAAKLLRSRPNQITILGPLVVYFFTMFAGTAHIIYSLLPVISEVATKKRIRPERSLSMAVIAAHFAIVASPVSAATATMLTIVNDGGLGLGDILMISIPATLIGTILGIISVLRMGKDLDKDPEFLEKMKDPEFAKTIEGKEEEENFEYSKAAKTSVVLFAIGIGLVVLFGSFSAILPNFINMEGFEPNFVVGDNGKIRMAAMIEMTMLAITGLIILITKTPAAKVAKASLFSSATTATIAVFGVVWMSATFMDANKELIEGGLGSIVTEQPWTFAIALFILAALLFSQAATTKALMPLGVLLGIPYPMLIAFFPAVSADFVIPGYPTLLAAINMDRTGTTKIGKYVLNHSFMLPGMVTTVGSIVAGIVIVKLFI